MIGRIASLSFFLASAGVAIAWLTLLPSLFGGADRRVLPYLLAADLAVVAIATFLILYLTLGRPLRRTEAAIDQLGAQRWDLPIAPGGGPLLSRIQAALRRMGTALADEQAVTRRQLEELRAANERLQNAQAELVASERLATVGRLAAGVAHEVGNPLSGILGYLSLLRARAPDPQAREFVDRIEGEVQRIDAIVRGLLELGRPAASAAQPVELARLVRTCADLVAASPELKDVEVAIDASPDVVARADPGPLSQVVLNLLLNAGQAMGGRGRIRVAATRAGDRVRLHVEDEGPGLRPEVAARMFEPFFTTREAGKGSGLGLAVSLHLARSMGGQLTGENRAEGGARFTLELPSARGVPQ